MIIEKCEQGSPEWFAFRAGTPSASSFDKIVTTKGVLSKSADKYAMTLAAEKVTGHKEESYQNAAMTRGIEMEAEARSFYEMATGEEVEQVGLVWFDENKDRSCSPDGLMQTLRKGLEIKCPTMAVHVSYILDPKSLLASYFQQAHGGMYITGYDSWVLMSYYPGVKPVILTVTRDEAFISSLHIALNGFIQEMNEIVEKIR